MADVDKLMVDLYAEVARLIFSRTRHLANADAYTVAEYVADRLTEKVAATKEMLFEDGEIS